MLSILAGVELAQRSPRAFPSAGGLVRIMPNLAAAIGKSPIALVGAGLTMTRRPRSTALMAPLGTPEWLADEGLFDARHRARRVGAGLRLPLSRRAGAGRGGARARPASRRGGWRWRRSTARPRSPPHRPQEPGELAAPRRQPRRHHRRPGSTCSTQTRALDALIAATLRAARDRSARAGARGGEADTTLRQARAPVSLESLRVRRDIAPHRPASRGAPERSLTMANWNDPQPTPIGRASARLRASTARSSARRRLRSGPAPPHAFDLQLHGLGRAALGHRRAAVRALGPRRADHGHAAARG